MPRESREHPTESTPPSGGPAIAGEAHPASAAAPAPSPGEIRLSVSACLLTGLERAAVRGLAGFRGVPGHAFVGIVDAVGPGGDDRLLGTRVAPAPLSWCGRCGRCRGGLREHCVERTVLGLERRDGGLARYALVPEASAVALPETLDDEVAVFAAPLGSALAVRRQVPVASRGYVTILGDGTIGMLVAQVLAPVNPSVRLVGRSSEKLALCERWGVKARHADDVGRRGDQDVVIDCTGREEGLELATRLCRPRGTIVLKSLLPPASRLAPGVALDPVPMGEQQLIGSFLGPVDEAVRLLAGGAIDVLPLLEQRIRLDAAARVLAAPRVPGSRAILVRP